MSYNKITSFAVKDTMADVNPLKVVRGKEFDDEFDAITTAMASQDSVIANLVTTPTGGVIMFAAPGTPTGFLPCDGAARSRNTYTALFQAIGTTYGAGDGSTTFNVPNMSGRFPYGGALAQVGGSADSTVPSHTHTATSTTSEAPHFHTTPTASTWSNGGSGPVTYASGASVSSSGFNGVSDSKTTGVSVATSIAATGVSPTNTNLPPFIGLAFIIKT